MKKLSLALASTALLAGTVAIAQPAERPERGPMTRDAVVERTDRAFDRMDLNDDGVVNEADREARALQRFARLDTDGNGSISQAEFLAQHEARAERREQRAERMGERRAGKRGMRGMGRRGGMIQGADADNDGTLTQAEFRAAALARFDASDTDGDGTITAAERRTARAAMRETRRAAQGN